MTIIDGRADAPLCEYAASSPVWVSQEAEARKLKQAADESDELSKVVAESTQNQQKNIDSVRRANVVREEQLAREAREEKEELGSTRGVFDKEQRRIDEEAQAQMARDAHEEEEALQLMQQEAEQQARRAKETHEQEESQKLLELEQQQQQRKEQEKNEQLQAKEARCHAATKNPFRLIPPAK